MFPVLVVDEEAEADSGEQEYQVRVRLVKTLPTGQSIYEDDEGQLYAASYAGVQTQRVVKIEGDEDELFNPNQDQDSEPSPAELVAPRNELTDDDEEARDADLSIEERDALDQDEAVERRAKDNV
jgi:hypothetical protein